MALVHLRQRMCTRPASPLMALCLILRVFAIANATGYEGSAHITFGGGQYFVVWTTVDSFFLSPPASRVYGRRVGTDGALLDGSADTSGIEINTTLLAKADLDVAFDGSNYLVVWRMGSFSNSPPAGVYGARVSLAGELLDGPAEGDGVVVSGTPPDYSRYPHRCINSRLQSPETL